MECRAYAKQGAPMERKKKKDKNGRAGNGFFSKHANQLVRVQCNANKVDFALPSPSWQGALLLLYCFVRECSYWCYMNVSQPQRLQSWEPCEFAACLEVLWPEHVYLSAG